MVYYKGELSMARTSLYIDRETKGRVQMIAKTERRTIAQTLRQLVALWNATTAVERAEILSRQQQEG